MAPAKITEGIMLYDVLSDGSLNGSYTNEHAPDDGTIFTETALKIQDGPGSDICGKYTSFYFDSNNQRRDGTLTVQLITPGIKAHEFTWTDSLTGEITFRGIGYKMNQRQVAVHYQSVRGIE